MHVNANILFTEENNNVWRIYVYLKIEEGKVLIFIKFIADNYISVLVDSPICLMWPSK